MSQHDPEGYSEFPSTNPGGSAKFFGGRTPHSEFPQHLPVLLREVIDYLAPKPGATIVDCTAGLGGHSLAILPHLLPDGRLIAIDRDPQAVALAQQRLREFQPQLEVVAGNFHDLPELLAEIGVSTIDGLVADLGLSSLHVDQPQRGFSFLREGPLDMRMDPQQSATAASLLQRLSERELAQLFTSYGEERWARRIAKRIVALRHRTPLRTTTQLARLVAESVPGGTRPQRIHPATRIFQALRIAVNEELTALETLLHDLPGILAPGARAVILTYHSLEDRLVKHAFRQGAQAGQVRVLTPKPIRPAAQELRDNPRSRSAKLRAVERLR